MTNERTNENRAYCESIREEIENIYNGTATTEDGEQISIYDYICNDVLDYETTHNSAGDMIGCRLYVTLGGPNVWIDTRNAEIALAWGTDRESVWLPSELCEMIDDAMTEIIAH